MALTQLGNAAGTTALDAGTPRPIVVPQQASADDPLLDAIRSSLVPHDPVPGLLARWPAPPARAVEVVRRGRGGRPGPA